MEGQGGDFKLKKSHRDAGSLGGDSGQRPSDSGRESPRTGTLQARAQDLPKGQGPGWMGPRPQAASFGGKQAQEAESPSSFNHSIKIFPTNGYNPIIRGSFL